MSTDIDDPVVFSVNGRWAKQSDLESYRNYYDIPWPQPVDLGKVVEFANTKNKIPETKPSNPKDIIGSDKLDMGLVPDTLQAYAALAFTEGALKYGCYNWRACGVRSSIYNAALRRHLSKWWNGEDVDPETGVPHLANIIACVGIILDAEVCGKLTDDRPPRAPLAPVIDSFKSSTMRLKEVFASHNPHQYTIADVIPGDRYNDRPE